MYQVYKLAMGTLIWEIDIFVLLRHGIQCTIPEFTVQLVFVKIAFESLQVQQ